MYERILLALQRRLGWALRFQPSEWFVSVQRRQTLMVMCKKSFHVFIWHLFFCLAFISRHYLYFILFLCCIFVSYLLVPLLFCFPFLHVYFLSLYLAVSSTLTDIGQESVPPSAHNATVVVSAAGVMPYLQGRAGEQNSALSIATNPSAPSSTSSSSSTSCERQPAPPGTMVSSQLTGESYSLGISNSGLGPPPPKPPGGVYTSTGQHNSSDGCLTNMVSTSNKNVLYYSCCFWIYVWCWSVSRSLVCSKLITSAFFCLKPFNFGECKMCKNNKMHMTSEQTPLIKSIIWLKKKIGSL